MYPAAHSRNHARWLRIMSSNKYKHKRQLNIYIYAGGVLHHDTCMYMYMYRGDLGTYDFNMGSISALIYLSCDIY